MGPGITLVILGAILTFAIRADSDFIDVHVVGVIFMIAGGAIIAYARHGHRREHVVTRVEKSDQPDVPTRTVHETVVDREFD